MIGVFDSGFGGLTILRALQDLPGRPDLVYLGDNARAPYGPRSGREIVDLTREGSAFLFAQGCRLVVLGCNTAATIALRPLQQHWLPQFAAIQADPINLLGIVVPTIERATGQLWADNHHALIEGDRIPLPSDQVIGLFATTRTVESQVFQIEIAKRRPDLTVIAQACPDLAGAIERGADRQALARLVATYVGALRATLGGRDPDRVILGCTHYPLVADLFAAHLGPNVTLIDQAHSVVPALTDYLGRHPEYRAPKSSGSVRFLTTGYDAGALGLAESFWGAPIRFEQVELSPVAA